MKEFQKADQDELDLIPTYLIPSVISMLAFCGVFGIIATVCACLVVRDKKRGDADTARQHSGDARFWMIIAFTLGIMFWLAQLFIYFKH